MKMPRLGSPHQARGCWWRPAASPWGTVWKGSVAQWGRVCTLGKSLKVHQLSLLLCEMEW